MNRRSFLKSGSAFGIATMAPSLFGGRGLIPDARAMPALERNQLCDAECYAAGD